MYYCILALLLLYQISPGIAIVVPTDGILPAQSLKILPKPGSKLGLADLATNPDIRQPIVVPDLTVPNINQPDQKQFIQIIGSEVDDGGKTFPSSSVSDCASVLNTNKAQVGYFQSGKCVLGTSIDAPNTQLIRAIAGTIDTDVTVNYYIPKFSTNTELVSVVESDPDRAFFNDCDVVMRQSDQYVCKVFVKNPVSTLLLRKSDVGTVL